MIDDTDKAILNIRLNTLEQPTLGLLNSLSDRTDELLHELIAREAPDKPIAVWLVRKVDVGSLAIEVEGRPAHER
jgi:hypothetical protein